jgi:hypothetical protein
MANRFAVANGDWSNTATWDGGTLPTSADDVYTNNFNVNVNQNIDVISLRNTAATGITAGGTFTFNTSGVTADISNTIVMNFSLATSTFILITANSGLITINIPNGIILDIRNGNLINYTGDCDLTFTCVSFVGTSPNIGETRAMINKTSSGLLIFNGNIFGRFTDNNNGGILFLQSTSTTIINGTINGGSASGFGSSGVNITQGNLTVVSQINGGTGSRGVGIYSTSTGIINITGNLIGNIGNAVNSTNGTINITGDILGGIVGGINSLNSTLNITGTINGGTSNGITGVLFSGTGTLNHTGVAQASAFGSAITCNAPTTSTVTCTGPFLRNGNITAIASQTLRINALFNPYFEFRKSDNSGAIYVETSAANFPAELDVREGTSYASNTLTGTLAVPLPEQVLTGVPVDDTVGTYNLTAEGFLDAIENSSTDLAVRLRNVSTVASTGAQIASYSV